MIITHKTQTGEYTFNAGIVQDDNGKIIVIANVLHGQARLRQEVLRNVDGTPCRFDDISLNEVIAEHLDKFICDFFKEKPEVIFLHNVTEHKEAINDFVKAVSDLGSHTLKDIADQPAVIIAPFNPFEPTFYDEDSDETDIYIHGTLANLAADPLPGGWELYIYGP